MLAPDAAGGRKVADMSEGHSGAGFPARGIAYLDRRFVPMEEAKISVMTHAFNYGTGCFEGIRGYWNEEDEELYVFHMKAHYERLLRSCRTLMIDLKMSADDLCDLTLDLLRRNEARYDIYIRPLAYK